MTRLNTEQSNANRGHNTGNSESTMQNIAQDPTRADNSSFGGEGRAHKRLHKQSHTGTNSPRPSEPTPASAVRSDASPFAGRRRQSSFRDTQYHGTSSQRSAYDNLSNSQMNAQRRPTANASTTTHARQRSSTYNSRLSFSSTNFDTKSQASNSSGTFDFLPSVNFDDFHASIASEEPDISLFPVPGETPKQSRKVSNNIPLISQRSGIKDPAKVPDASDSGSRIGLNGSSIRRHGSSAQRNGQAVREPDSTGLSAATRTRRKSYFSGSTSTANGARPPRKSVGPGILTSEFESRTSQFPRPSLAQIGLGHTTHIPKNDKDVGNGGLLASQSRNFDSSRYQKAKSMQPGPDSPSGNMATSRNGSDNMDIWTASIPRSPARHNLQRTLTPSSSKRLSMMPNSAHATGLAARTISPTDARRMKRMSMMPNPPRMPYTPPTPQPDTPSSIGFPSAPSPSLLPRKSITPSSSRTTPDPNRKSYSSGFSNSSSTSYNSFIASNGSMRMSQSISTSRLPTPKYRGDVSSMGDDEVVPPVPAIPKAYESPKEELASPFFPIKKPTRGYEVNSLKNTSSMGGIIGQHDDLSRESARVNQDMSVSRPVHFDAVPSTEKKPSGGKANRRTLQPLRLPPLNLLPLSTPTASKIAALYDSSSGKTSGNVTPPPKQPKATPTTPMTASKASYSRNYYEDESSSMPMQIRSISSVHATRPELPSYRAPSNSSVTVPDPADLQTTNTNRTAISPFISSSLPKNSGEFGYRRRDISNPAAITPDIRPSKLTGPRLQKLGKSSKDDPSCVDIAGSTDTSTHSIGTSIRRKLSLTRKRSASKVQMAAERETEYPPKPPNHGDMPPPKLPASATWNGPLMATPSPSQKLRGSRKVSDTSTIVPLDRNRSSIWDAADPPKKSSKPPSGAPSPDPKRIDRSVLESSSMSNAMSLKEFIREAKTMEVQLDRDDLAAEEEMKRLATKRKDTENAAKELDALRRRATAKDRVSPSSALRVADLNIFERGEIVDYKDVYFCGKQGAKKHVGNLTADVGNFGYDDDRGDYNIVLGDHLAYRYEIVDVLGKGSFGQVVRCVDHRTGDLVAIKIIRNKKRFHQQALVEVDILQKLREWDPQSKHSMVSFVQSFYFRGHLCISTELLGMNLYEFIKCHDFRGFSLKLIRRFAKQLLSSLVLLKGHRVIHCDLKPENVLLAHPAHSEIKVIDFGSSCLENEKVYTYIQSRFYRSPEVILGMTYGMPIDMWSLGCILAELLTGYPIFPGENEQEQLACIMEVFGPPEKHLIEKSTRKKLFFDSLGKPRITVSSKGKRRRPSSKSLQQTLKCEDEAFLDFITRCLRWDPDRRLKPDEAINHDFITGRSTKTTAPSASTSRPRTAPANNSSLKRFNSISQNANTTRPLPDPPAATFKIGIVGRNRDTSITNNLSAASASPSKQAAQAVGAAKRHSTVNSMATASAGIGAKRSATGAAVQGSALPRIANNQRTGSIIVTGGASGGRGPADMAAAAAAVSLAQKSR